MQPNTPDTKPLHHPIELTAESLGVVRAAIGVAEDQPVVLVAGPHEQHWHDGGLTIPKDLETLLLDEGLALAWVPPPATVKKLFEATSAQERRRILGARWRTITGACIREMEGIESTPLTEYVEFALSAARTLLNNDPRPAQALSANLLDTILRQNFDDTARKTITGQQTRMDIDDYPLRVAIVLGGIWGSFGEFWAEQ